MKKVFIQAYCRQNLGDDMFVLKLVQRYPDVSFYADVEAPYQDALKNEHNLLLSDPVQKKPMLNSWAVKQFIHRFGYDAFVKIGGSIFMEPLDWKPQKPFPAWQAKLLNSNKFIVGANFGPYYTQAFLERARSSLRYYRGVCFRDRYSYNLFSEFNHVQNSPDVLFGYTDIPEPRAGHGVGISVVALEKKLLVNQYAEKYYDILAQVCDRLICSGIPVKLLSFCKAEGDTAAIEAILRRMEYSQKAAVCNYDGNISAFLNVLNDCNLIMATRFHAMILGFVMNKTVFPICYSEKQTHVLEDCGFRGSMWNLLEGELPEAEEIIQRCVGNPKLPGIKQLAERSDTQFIQLDRLLLDG